MPETYRHSTSQRATAASRPPAAGDASRVPLAGLRRADHGCSRRRRSSACSPNPRAASAAVRRPRGAAAACGIDDQGAGKIPFICFDLAGGANMAGSNVLVGKQGGQLDFLSTAGYSKLGLPGDMSPRWSTRPPAPTTSSTPHSASRSTRTAPILRGMLDASAGTRPATINGAVIPARSENDTGNNPHNPMYGIARAGADGSC